MQKNLLIVLVVLFLTSNSWSAHLLTPENCIPCILAANSLRKAQDNALDTIIAITSDEGRENIEDFASPGCPSTSTSDKNVEVKKIMLANGRTTIREKNDDSIATRYILNMDQARKRANTASIEAILKPEHMAVIPRHHEKQRHDKRYINCEYATLPVRHARAADAREGQKGKRRAAAADLTLCHFKICNMGRKRNQRYFHALNEYEN